MTPRRCFRSHPCAPAAGPRALALVLAAGLLAGSAAADRAGAEPAAPPPVVVLVLDGLSRSWLLDADGAIDAAWYPAFAELASRSTRFTAATTVAVRANDALPAIASGRLPGVERRLAIVDDHPQSLFTLLAGGYVMNVLETESILNDDGGSRAVHERRLQAMRSDRNEDVEEHVAWRKFVRRVGPVARQAAKRGQGSLHFVHVRLPRYPWHLSTEGTSYRPYRAYGNRFDVWSDEAWWSEEGWRRQLMQLRFVDVLLGELLSALREAKIDDDALIVLTATYGMSFWPGESGRSLDASEHPEDALHVPLWVKRPGQPAGTSNTRPAQTIDVLPTIAGVLGRPPGHPVDGCSLFDGDCAPIEQRVVIEADANGRRRLQPYPLGLTDRTATLARRIERIGSGRSPGRVYAFGSYAASVGRRVESFEVGAVAGTAVPNRQWVRTRRGARRPPVPKSLELAQPPDETPQVAVVRAGVVETVVPAPLDARGGRSVVAMIPERAGLAADAPLALYLVEGPPDAPRLREITVRPGRKGKRGG